MLCCDLFISRALLCVFFLVICSSTHACTSEDLASTINSSIEFHKALLRKAEYGELYARPEEKSKAALAVRTARDELRKSEREAQAQLAMAFSRVNADYRTKVLIYGSSAGRKCVWLISGTSEIITSSIGADLSATTTSVREGLKVKSVNRVPRNGKCSFTARVPVAKTDEEMAMATKALAKASEQLLPPRINSALLNDGKTERLIIIPFADLRAIPFSALPLDSGGTAIVDKFAVLIVPQFPIMLESEDLPRVPGEEPATDRKFLIVGDPDLSEDRRYCWSPLPNALAEAEYVSRRVGAANPLLGRSATFGSVKARLDADASALKLIFFSTHGVSDDVNPADKSFLALKDSHFRGSNIRALSKKLTQKPIVVLSACQTGLGKTFDQGMFGLIESWRSAGASQVVASLWDVEDEGTAALMKLFTDSLLLREFRGSEFAMAEAMRSLKRSNSHPSVWGAFNVFGNP